MRHTAGQGTTGGARARVFVELGQPGDLVTDLVMRWHVTDADKNARLASTQVLGGKARSLESLPACLPPSMSQALCTARGVAFEPPAVRFQRRGRRRSRQIY